VGERGGNYYADIKCRFETILQLNRENRRIGGKKII
jgi:hypothetical protein